MYLTQSNQVKGLNNGEYEALREMCRYAKNLYNVGLYSIRQYFFAEGRFLRYESNYQAVKDNENYALLQAGVSQQILKVVDRSFRSFFNLLKKAKCGEYRYHDVRIPHYLDKNDYFPLILSTNAIVIKDGYFQVPTMNRNNQVRDYMMKSGRYIVNYCLSHEIGTILIGYNPDWKRGSNMGKQNNQNFVQIPHGQLRNQLENLCERYGLQYIEQEESYTSKASSLEGDNIPIWNGTHQEVTFSGKRIERGLYRAKDGRTLNADVNGAANILRKSNHRLDFERVARGLLANPLRVKLT